MKETYWLRRAMLRLARLGFTVFRNNVGVARYGRGARVRYGLAKGASDIIGWKTVTIEECHLGMELALFTAVEVKTEQGRLTREQCRFLDAVARAGGLAYVVKNDRIELWRDHHGNARTMAQRQVQ